MHVPQGIGSSMKPGNRLRRSLNSRRRAEFITPIPKPKKRKAAAQAAFVFDEGKGLSTKEQQYDPTSIINEVRGHVDAWRACPTPINGRSRRKQPGFFSTGGIIIQRHPPVLLSGRGGGNRDLAHRGRAPIQEREASA